MRRSAVALSAAALLLAACGQSGAGSPSARTPDGTAAAPPAATAVPSPAPTATAALGPNQRQIGDLLLTVNSVAPYSDTVWPAAPGSHYIAVDVTALNTGAKVYSINPYLFRLQDSDQYAVQVALTYGPDPEISAIDMAPGQSVRGFLVFQVGDGRVPVELQYQSFTGTPGRIPLR